MRPPNASTAAAAVLVDELVRGGLRHVVLAPGSRSTAVAIAVLRHEALQVHVDIDERSAGFFALGIGRATGIAAAVLTTSGSAVANLLPAVVEAETGLVPLLVLTADRPEEMRGTGANQTIEQAGIFGRHVRWAGDPGVPAHDPAMNDRWRSAVCHAVASAVDGPVHLNLPFREPLVPETDDGRDTDAEFEFSIEGRDDGSPWKDTGSRHVAPVSLSPAWAGSERGVVVAGDAPFASPAEVDRLAASLGWPLVAEPTLGTRPPQAITTAHHLMSDPGLADFLRPDTALVIGRVNLSRPVGAWLSTVPTLVVDPRVHRTGRANAEVLEGWPLVVEPVGRSGTWRRRWLDVERVARRALDGALDAEPGSEPRLARDVAAAIPEGGMLTVASSMPVRDLDMTMPGSSVRVVANRGASGIDGFVSTTLGVAAAGRRPVVALAGDLAMLHDGNGLLVDPRPDAVFVVVNNDGGGIFHFLPQVRQTDVFERAFGTPHGRSFEDFARFHRLRYAAVEDVGRQIGEALGAGGTWLLEARTDREANPGVHRRITAAVVAAVAASLEG